MTQERPDPEAVLARLRTEEPQAAAVSTSPQRGTLRVFLGYAAGVGKTYSMLSSARAASAAGRDVAIGYVEHHGRSETEALLDGLERLPLRTIEYRGTRLRELDLDGALARRPEVLLVDELAHTNAPGSLHSRRWQDVEQLLDAGINVWTTLNIQHVESLNDIVAKVTGILVRETVPDRVIDEATEIELVDIPPEELLERLAEGKVYVPEQARRAIERFFAKTNLLALRELSMRRVADRVGEQVDTARLGRGRDTVWPTRERLLVCVGQSPTSAKVIRTAKRLASAMHAEWTAVHLATPGERQLDDRARHRLAKHLQLAERLGADTVTLSGEDVAAELVRYAHSRSVTKIVIGKTREGGRGRLWGRLRRDPSIVERLIELSGDTDVYVIQGVEERSQRSPPRAPAPGLDAVAYLKTAGALGLATGLSSAFHLLGFPDATLVMAYLLAVVVVASWLGRGPAIVSSVVSVLLYNFLFTSPYYTFTVDDPGHLYVFAVMLLVAVTVSGVTARIRERLEGAREQERHLAALYRVSQHLAVTTGTLPLVSAAESLLAELVPGSGTIFLPGSEGLVPALRRDVEEPAAELAAARWVFEHRQVAGRGTDTLPAAGALYLPLLGAAGPVGVLGWRARTEADVLAARRLLDTFATQVALALERDQLARDAQRVLAEAEAERLRSSLLSALSHDLRTPIAAIAGSASSLLHQEGTDPTTRRELAESIYLESDRLGRLVENLLHMTRIHAGRLEIDEQWHPLEEVVGSALNRLERAIGAREVRIDIPPDLPLLPMDGLLVEQVLVNLLDNALKYCPADSPIEIGARAAAGAAEVWVADRGPGIPADERERVFEKFFRGATSRGRAERGAGLGLAICHAIVQAHGGRIHVEPREGGGSRFLFTLPRGQEPPPEAPEDPPA
ncbi:MAG: DUF4118 domain-containing protein [Planctomycetota bacterium]